MFHVCDEFSALNHCSIDQLSHQLMSMNEYVPVSISHIASVHVIVAQLAIGDQDQLSHTAHEDLQVYIVAIHHVTGAIVHQ